MKRAFFAMFAGVALLGGCAQQPPADPTPVQKLAAGPAAATTDSSAPAATATAPTALAGDPILARVNGQPITRQQLVAPLVEAHGLPLLLNLVQLELARQDARTAHVSVSPEDIRHEQELTMAKLFKDSGAKEQDQLDDAERKGLTERANQLREQIRKDRETLLVEYLQNKNYTRTEYDIVIEINAYIRKVAEPLLKGKITDDLVEKEFGMEYGETVQIHYIQLANMLEVNEARRKLKAGEKFEDVAEQMSRNARTAALGGKFQTFSRQTPGLPDSFKQLAFSLQPGQISDTLNVGGNYFIMRLDEKFPPKAVKFDSVKESLRASMYDRVMQATMEDLRNALGQQAMTALKVDDPVLAKQFDLLKQQREAKIHDKQKIDEQMKKERARVAQEAATQPAPATQPSTAPAATAPNP